MAVDQWRARESSKAGMTWISRRKLMNNWPAAMSQSPSNQARFCQPVRPWRTLVYSGLLKRLSVTRAGMKMVSVWLSQRWRRGEWSVISDRYGMMNLARYQAWPMPPGLVVEWMRGRQLGVRGERRMGPRGPMGRMGLGRR